MKHKLLVFAAGRTHYDNFVRRFNLSNAKFVTRIQDLYGIPIGTDAIILEGYERNLNYTMYVMFIAGVRLNPAFLSEAEQWETS